MENRRQMKRLTLVRNVTEALVYSTTKETHQSLFGAIMEIRIKK